MKIVPPGERRPMFCDLVDKSRNVLIEAKGSVTREDVRMAIGQLIDYRRFADTAARAAVLLPEKPRHDLVELLRSAGVEGIWPIAGDYEGTAAHLSDRRPLAGGAVRSHRQNECMHVLVVTLEAYPFINAKFVRDADALPKALLTPRSEQAWRD